eukprot:sb/3478737/
MFHVCRSRTGPKARCELTRAERLMSGELTDCVARQPAVPIHLKHSIYNHQELVVTQRELMTARRTPKPTITSTADHEGTVNFEEKIQDLTEVTGDGSTF